MGLSTLFDKIFRSLTEPAPALSPLPAPRGLGSAVVAVRSDYNVEVLPGPETSRRTHNFHELRSFADWLNRFAAPDAAEILVGDTAAKAVLGDDPHASEVTCLLRHHPTFALWHKAFGVKQAPKAFHAFIRSVAATFDTGTGGVNAADVLSGEMQKLKAVTTGDVEMSVDPRGFYSVIGNTAKVQVDAKIPPTFSISTPIFVGIPKMSLPIIPAATGAEVELVVGLSEPFDERLYSLEILLTMDVESNGIFFTLTCPTLDRVLHEARLDAVAHLRTLLKEGFLVGLGDLQTEVVPG